MRRTSLRAIGQSGLSSSCERAQRDEAENRKPKQLQQALQFFGSQLVVSLKPSSDEVAEEVACVHSPILLFTTTPDVATTRAEFVSFKKLLERHVN
jgi:hypothetical protein